MRTSPSMWIYSITGTVSRDGISSNNLRGKSDFVKGSVSQWHLKDSALCQVSYSKYHGIFQIAVFLQFFCGFSVGNTFNLERKAFFITNRTICQTEQFQFAVLNNCLVGNHYDLEPLCLAKNTAINVAKRLIPNCSNCKNTLI